MKAICRLLPAALLVTSACAGGPPPEGPAPANPPVAAAPQPGAAPAPAPSRPDTTRPKERVAPPQIAAQLGLMPVASTGMNGFRRAHPTIDGRGVLIAILDSGLDPGIAGLRTTSTGQNKVLDLRDFSDEGLVELTDAGNGRWTGELRELPFGPAPASDFNGNGSNRDRYRVEVMRDAEGWMARIDSDGDGQLDDEQWLRDFLVRRETFTFSSARVPPGRGPITAAVNLSEAGGRPRLVYFMDTSGHGSHVAGIAAGSNMYAVPNFSGVAPGAQLLGLKIANNVRGGVSTTGSMIRAMEYAARFAAEQRLPLVLNMSFGVGNANEGRAVMDSVINAFLMAHPDVFFAIAAGNDGPGTSTMGLPGTAELAVSVGASYPGPLAAVQYNAPVEVMGWWSSRGAESNKPDIVAPGVAYSTVPGWDTGEEIKGGTSMASPHVAGLAAVLISGMLQQQQPYTAASVAQALRATARPFRDVPWIDQGPGLARIENAWQWLSAAPREVPRYRVEALPPSISSPPDVQVTGGPNVAAVQTGPKAQGAYRRNGFASTGDTVQLFRVSLVPDPGIRRVARTYRLVSTAEWLRPVQPTVTIDATTGSAVVDVHYDRGALMRSGRHSAEIIGIAADDSTAGPAFVLVNTVVVAETGRIGARRAALRPGTTARYYLNVPAGSSGLSLRTVVAESAMAGSVSLYEPSGQPARSGESAGFGGESPRTVTLAVRSEDVVPGVYEIVVQALPGMSVVYDLEARVSTVRIDSAGPAEVVVQAPADTALVAVAVPLGADTAWTATVRDALDKRTFAVPEWAAKMVAEVEVAPELWDQVTDLAITMYDGEGARIGNGPMNYPFNRVTADLPENRAAGYQATLELFAGFALPTARPFDARVRVRFEAKVDSTANASASASAAASRTVALTPGQFAVPPGWRRVVKVSVGATANDPLATTRLVGLP